MFESAQTELLHLPVWLIPVLIFLARIVDVSIGTLRIMTVGRGMRALSSILGFFEVLIWLAAISQIVSNLTSWQNYIAYAAGFATGTWVGMTIERRLSLGMLLVRVIVPRGPNGLLSELIERQYRVTSIAGEGVHGPVTIIFTIVKRGRLNDLLSLIKSRHPSAYYSVEDVRTATDPIATQGAFVTKYPTILQPFAWFRKGK